MVPGNFFLGSLVGCLFIDWSVKFQKNMKYLVRYILSAGSCFMSSLHKCASHQQPITFSLVLSCALAPTEYLSSLPLNNRERHRSTLVCTILQKSVTFFMINNYIVQKTFQLKVVIWKMV